MTDDFLKFDGDIPTGSDDFPFDVSSAIPEHELLDFNPTAYTGLQQQENAGGYNFGINSNGNNENDIDINIETINDNQLGSSNISDLNDRSDTLDPTTLLSRSSVPGSVHDSFHKGYASPAQSSYPINSHLSTSFQAQRQGSIYDTLESIASPGQQSTSDAINAQYFSPPASKHIPFQTQRKNSIYLQPSSFQHSLGTSINSPGTSFNDALSPYASVDALRSPRSMAASPGGGSLPKQQMSKDEKLRRRREFHNQVERRRRDLIKQKIKELGLIVPPSLLLVDDDGKEVKASKSVIINKTVQYVEHLHKVLEAQKTRQEELITRIEELSKYPDRNTTPTSSAGDINSTSSEPLQHQQQLSAQPQQQQQQQQQRQDYNTGANLDNNTNGASMYFDVDAMLKTDDWYQLNNWTRNRLEEVSYC